MIVKKVNISGFKKTLLMYIFLPLAGIFIFSNLINASIDKNGLSIKSSDFWFDRITKCAGSYKLIKIVANNDLRNVTEDIENPFEDDLCEFLCFACLKGFCCFAHILVFGWLHCFVHFGF